MFLTLLRLFHFFFFSPPFPNCLKLLSPRIPCLPSLLPVWLSPEVNHSLVALGLFPILYIPLAWPWVAVERCAHPAHLFLSSEQTPSTNSRQTRCLLKGHFSSMFVQILTQILKENNLYYNIFQVFSSRNYFSYDSFCF